MTIRLAIVGLGKIARDQHVPAIAADPRFALVATADPGGTALPGVPAFGSLTTLLAEGPDRDAVAVCTPPLARHGVAREALAAGLHVLLEKPPGATLGAVADLRGRAAAAGRTVFAAWHSREAPGVAAARDWLAARRPTSVRVGWREDVRVWHPGQTWIFEAGGLGVFDPGVNALSILTALLPGPIVVTAATLRVPTGRDAPVAAELSLDAGGVAVRTTFDFDFPGTPEWTMTFEADGATLRLDGGGHRVSIDGAGVAVPARAEYPALYDRFAALIASGQSELDDGPLRVVADAFTVGRRVETAWLAR